MWRRLDFHDGQPRLFLGDLAIESCEEKQPLERITKWGWKIVFGSMESGLVLVNAGEGSPNNMDWLVLYWDERIKPFGGAR